MVGLDVTMQALCDQAYFDHLAKAHPEPVGALHKASRLYLDFYESNMGTRGCSLHDPTAVIACTYPELFQMQRLPIVVVENGDEMGRTILAPDHCRPAILVCVEGDMAAVKARFASVFGAS